MFVSCPPRPEDDEAPEAAEETGMASDDDSVSSPLPAQSEGDAEAPNQSTGACSRKRDRTPEDGEEFLGGGVPGNSSVPGATPASSSSAPPDLSAPLVVEPLVTAPPLKKPRLSPSTHWNLQNLVYLDRYSFP